MQKEKRCKKKKMITIGGVAIIAVAGIVLMTIFGGGASKSLKNQAKANISEAHFFMMCESQETKRVQIYSGIREQNYKVDGIPGATVPFTLINIIPIGPALANASELRGKISINGTESEPFILDRNQFGRNFAHDLGKEIEKDAKVIFTIINTGGVDEVFENFAMTMPEKSITWSEALGAGVEHFAKKLKAASNFETYVKLTSDPSNVGIFWQVSFVTDANVRHIIILDPAGATVTSSSARTSPVR